MDTLCQNSTEQHRDFLHHRHKHHEDIESIFQFDTFPRVCDQHTQVVNHPNWKPLYSFYLVSLQNRIAYLVANWFEVPQRTNNHL